MALRLCLSLQGARKIACSPPIGIVGDGNFFGEGSLAGQIRRTGSAAALTSCELLRVEKKAMMAALHREHAFSEMFVAYLLARNIRYEEDRSINCFIPGRRDWPASFCCWLVSARSARVRGAKDQL